MGGPYKLKKRGKPMTTIYDAAILLVDDNPDLLTLVTDNLRTAGYKTVCTAADCAAARAAFAAHRPDLMILDINLPDGDGFGLFRTLRTESDVPALFLSARDADADRLFGLGLGADDYLTKPFLMQELLLRVQQRLPHRAAPQPGVDAGGLHGQFAGRRRPPRRRHNVGPDRHRARPAAKAGR